MAQIEWNGLIEHLNGDGEFAYGARFWTASLRLDFGEAPSRRFRIRDGVVSAIDECTDDASSDVFISGNAEQWDGMLADIPKPFYQDIFGASLYHGVQLNQDYLDFAAYYPAIRRLLEILRERSTIG